MKMVKTWPRLPRQQTDVEHGALMNLPRSLLASTFTVYLNFWPRSQGSDPSDSDSSKATSSESESESHGVGTADMTLLKLESLHGLGGQRDQSSYAANGISVKRMKRALRNPPCGCESCGSLPLKTLQRTCQTFWALPKSGQDAILWSLQTSATTKTTWSIEGR